MNEATAFVHETMPLCRTLGVTVDSLSQEEVVMSLRWAPELCTAEGMLHGGTVMALADSAGAACAFANLPEGTVGTATIESKTNFFTAIRQGVVTARSRPLHVGRTTIVVETEVSDENDRLAAKVTQTQSVMHPRSDG